MGKRGQLSWKYILFLIVLLAIGTALAFPTYYVLKRTKTVLTEETQAKAVDIAHAISSFLEMDIEMYRKLSEMPELSEEDELWPYYQRVSGMMQSIKRKSDAAFIFTGRYVDDETSGYVLDGQPPESELFSPFGSTDGMNPTELLVYQTGKSLVSEVESDPQWGSFLTGYSPIMDERDGTMVGLVGVDYSAEFLATRIKRITIVLAIGFGLFTLAAAIALEVLILISHEKAHSDELTKLGNKRAFNKAITYLHGQATHFKRPYALLLLDIDLFKTINDTHGHPVGDTVLTAIAKTLLYAAPQAQFCFRYGGDEFAVLLPHSEEAQALQFKQLLQKEVRNIIIPALASQRFSVSIGIAVWSKEKQREDMISIADANLYQDKRSATRGSY